MAHRISYISNQSGKSSTSTFRTEKAAKNAWRGVNSSPYVRYAVWMDGPDIIAEIHAVYYLNSLR